MRGRCTIRYIVDRESNPRQTLLDGIVDYVFDEGVSDLSLRPLAEALGTSPRMLLYHFGSKEQLLSDVLAAARNRQYAMLTAWSEEGATLPELVMRYWEWAADDGSRPYMRLFFEVFGLAVQGRPGTGGVLAALSGQAVEFFKAAAGHSADESSKEELVRLSLAVLRGLLFDLLSTGERGPADAAMSRFLALLTSQLSTRKESLA